MLIFQALLARTGQKPPHPTSSRNPEQPVPPVDTSPPPPKGDTPPKKKHPLWFAPQTPRNEGHPGALNDLRILEADEGLQGPGEGGVLLRILLRCVWATLMATF